MKKVLLMFAAGLLLLSGCSSNKVTKQNLESRIVGELTQGAKFDAFAKKAAEEGLSGTSAVFQALSKSESILAENMTKLLTDLGGKPAEFKPEFEVKSTSENLSETLLSLSIEATSVYKSIIDTIKSEKSEEAFNLFTAASKIKENQKEVLDAFMKATNAPIDSLSAFSFGVCAVCGNIYDMSKADEKCAICGEPKDKFIIFK